MAQEKEDERWSNPCDYATAPESIPYKPMLARQVAVQAGYALNIAMQFKDEFASRLFQKDFLELSKMLSSELFLRKQPWFIEEVLPKEKVVGDEMNKEYVNKLVEDENKIKQVLPPMFKSLKLIYAGLVQIEGMIAKDVAADNEDLQKKINDTSSAVRQALCNVHRVTIALNLKAMPLYNSEVPQIDNDHFVTAFPVYRDTLNYLEYLQQVFQSINDADMAYTKN